MTKQTIAGADLHTNINIRTKAEHQRRVQTNDLIHLAIMRTTIAMTKGGFHQRQSKLIADYLHLKRTARISNLRELT